MRVALHESRQELTGVFVLLDSEMAGDLSVNDDVPIRVFIDYVWVHQWEGHINI